MSPLGTSEAKSIRLNPLCLPSDTGCRFVLLIVLVLGSSLFIYNGLALHKLSVPAYQRCMALGPSASELSNVPGITELRDPSALVAKSQAFSNCVRRVQLNSAIWMLAGLAGVLTATLSLMWFIPAWKKRRGRLVSLSKEDAPAVLACLETMSKEAGLPRLPRFLWNPFNSASTGLAFGSPGEPCVALSGGLVTQYYTDPAAFRAVVFHELAHIRNGDVSKTYFAVATWYAFLAVALAPFFAAMSWDFVSVQLWRVLALTLLVYWSRTAVLRVREMYADVRASVWDTPRGALRRVIHALPRPKEGAWRKCLRVHPTAEERSSALEDGAGLFRISFWETLLAGLAAGIALPNFSLLLQILVPGAMLVGLLASLTFAALLAGIVGTRIWRATLADLAAIGPAPKAARLGLALALGLLLGYEFSLYSAFDSGLTTGMRNPAIFWNCVLFVMLLAGSVLFMRWETISASTWLQASLTPQSLRGSFLGAQIVGTAFLTLVLGSLFVFWQVGDTYLGSGLPGFSSLVVFGLLVALNQPAFTLVLFALWAFPLATCLRRAPADANVSRFLFLEGETPTSAVLGSGSGVPLQPKVALRIGLTGGVVFCILHVMIRLVLHYSSPPGGQSDQSKMLLYYSQVLLAALIQAILAAVTAGRVRRLPLLHGLLAAFVGGCTMTGAFFAVNVALGGGVALKFASDTFQTMVNSGALAAIPLASLVFAFRRRIPHERAFDRPHEAAA
ncbi:MAG TPA: M48 family metalloprotease [Candidatus Acidoferrum sp.]|nr:M48 family metalloprotease [Candidatus Acidoferrum sp.]